MKTGQERLFEASLWTDGKTVNEENFFDTLPLLACQEMPDCVQEGQLEFLLP